jgi:hypothetical protein
MSSVRSLLLLMTVILVSSGFADEHVVTIDPKTKLITTEQNGVLKLYRIADSTQITVNGAASTLGQLLPGQTVAVKASDSITATKIAASGLGRTSAPAQPLALRSVTVQARVDGTDRIFYSDGKLWIEHLDANKPSDFIINGIEWKPTWNDKKSEPFTNFVIPVAPIGQGRVSVKQLSGRGKVKLERSTQAPGMVVIEDGKGGADDYAFEFVW